MAMRNSHRITIVGTDRKAMRGIEKPRGDEAQTVVEVIDRDGWDFATGVLTANDWLFLDARLVSPLPNLPLKRFVVGYGYTMRAKKGRGLIQMDYYKGDVPTADKSIVITPSLVEEYHYQKTKGASYIGGGKSARFREKVNPCGNHWRLDQTYPLVA